jgi:hypothetical protein
MPVDPVQRKGDRQDPGVLIASQIADLTDGRASVTLKRERPWASITFAGTRYCFAIIWADAAEPEAIENLAQTLPDHEFAIPGYFVADILVTEQSESQLLVEALLIDDPVE